MYVTLRTHAYRLDGGICESIYVVHRIKFQARETQWLQEPGPRYIPKKNLDKQLIKVLEGDLGKIVTHIVPQREADKVFDLIADKNSGAVKVAVDCTQK